MEIKLKIHVTDVMLHVNGVMEQAIMNAANAYRNFI
jgi:hypothetical protein